MKLMTCKMLKKYIFILAMGFFSLGVLANHPPLASKEQIGMFKNSKTCVVLENGSISSNLYNKYIKDAVQKYWKTNEVEVIDQQEFDKRRFDTKYSFLVLMDVMFDKDPEGVSYNYLSLVLGDTAKDMTMMPELCSIPLCYSSDHNVKYGYILPAIVKFMQKHVVNLEKKRFWVSTQGLEYYNGSASFKNKALLLNKDMMAPDANSPEKIKKVYPYQFQLLTGSEIEAKFAANPANTLFNLHVGPDQDLKAGMCFDMIFDTEGNLSYYHHRKITNEDKDGFNLKDFSRIK
jgi:hypothetical protein